MNLKNSNYVLRMNKIAETQTKDGLESQILQLIDCLVNNYLLMVNGIGYRIIECEIYFHSTFHPDPFVHCHPRQKFLNAWYVHRSGRGGIDLTFGNGHYFAGILIRSIECVDISEPIQGPSLVFQEICHSLTLKRSEAITSIEAFDPDDPKSPLKLIEAELPYKAMVCSPRVGLPIGPEVKDLRIKLDYIMKPYRFQTTPSSARKDKATTYLSLINQGMPSKWAQKLCGVRNSEATVYEYYFYKGRNRSPEGYLNCLWSQKGVCELMGSILL